MLRLGSTEATSIDVRVIAATNRNLGAEIGAGRFRQDLYYRLDILQLPLPPLRQRPEDIAPLARHFLAAALRRYRGDTDSEALLSALLPVLQNEPWPGNVRQLENLVERVAVVAAQLPPERARFDALIRRLLAPAAAAPPEPAAAPAALRERRRVAEQLQIQEVLAACAGNQAEAARRLGISRSTLWRKLVAAG